MYWSVTAQLLAHLGHVQRPERDGVGGAQHDKQVAQRGTYGARMARTRRATAAGEVMLEEIGNEPLVDVGQALVGVLHPHRQMHNRRFAVAHVADSIAAFREVLAVPNDVAIQLSAAAGTAGRVRARTRIGTHGSLQVVEPPVQLEARTIYSYSWHRGRGGRVSPHQLLHFQIITHGI